jgi:hypothetical protein
MAIPIPHRHSRLALAALLAVLAGLAAAPAGASVTLAETLLFQTNHLQQVRAPLTLVYDFHKAGSLEDGFDDQVRLLVDAGKGATVLFLSGARARRTPEIDDPQGNPVLLGFLERDIAEMHRLTGGTSSYFRKRIRLALAASAQVTPRRFTYGGRSVEGQEVMIEPYRKDPMHARFEQYTGKRYVFVLSPDVPGGIYQLRTVVPASPAAARKAPLLAETLTLVSVDALR